jgi:DNA polymerase V
MLRVTGNSMVDAGIFEGDLILADSKKEPKVNDIVIGLVDGENTVKRLVKKDGQYFLKAENPDYPEIVLHEELDCVIWGVVIHIIHSV